MSDSLSLVVLFAASMLAGAQNALAGGGSFVTLPALLLVGLDPLAANITSTVALFPGQVVSGWAGRRMTSGIRGLPFRALCALSLLGGGAGAILLLSTSATVFARLMPWLVLFATAVFAWGSFFQRSGPGGNRMGPVATGCLQFAIAVYGGYFGGGIGFLMLAALTAAGLAIRAAGATKNVLAAVMNLSALLVFVFSPQVRWGPAAVVCVAAILGGLAGVWILRRIPERLLRGGIVALGVGLTMGLFLRAP